MVKGSVITTISLLSLVTAAVAAYGMFNINTQIQAKQEQVKIPDYSSQLNSLKSQIDSVNSKINSINTNLPALDTLKSNIADIHTKLADIGNLKGDVSDIQKKLDDLQNSNHQLQQITPVSGKLTVALDKSTYSQGDKIHIAGIGASPLEVVQVQVLDSNGNTVVTKETWADSTGSIMYDLQLSASLLPGNYQIKLVSNQLTNSESITIARATTSTVLYTLTAQTDKGIYQTGDMIQVSGFASPNTGLTATMTSPTGKTYSSTTPVNSDGSYSLFFPTTSSYEVGTWYVNVNNLAQSKVISIFIEQGSSSTGLYTLTAQTDKASYTAGDLIQISGVASPNTGLTATMASPTGKTYSSTATVNSDGSYRMFFQTTPSYEAGNWHITLNNLAQTKVVFFTMVQGSSTGSYALTALTDKTIYHRGDLIQVSGKSTPNTAVTAVMTSPSGQIYNSGATTNPNGTYVLHFSTSASYETGNWYINVSNYASTKVVSIAIL